MYADDFRSDEEWRCAVCRRVRPLKEMLTCRCAVYGYLNHEDALWCSEDCREADHPDELPERPDEPQSYSA